MDTKELCVIYTQSISGIQNFFNFYFKKRSKALFTTVKLGYTDTGTNARSASSWRNSMGSLPQGAVTWSRLRSVDWDLCSAVLVWSSPTAGSKERAGLCLQTAPALSSASTSVSRNVIILPQLQSCENIILILVYVATMRSLCS